PGCDRASGSRHAKLRPSPSPGRGTSRPLRASMQTRSGDLLPYDLGVIVVEILFWASLAALVWTHVAYPLVVEVAARSRSRRERASEPLPSVVVIVAAHNEDTVIERRVENLLALDYPREFLQVVVVSDASDDRTDELAEAAGARVFGAPRGGKVAAQDRAVRETESDIVAFSDANSTWAPDALRSLVAPFA